MKKIFFLLFLVIIMAGISFLYFNEKVSKKIPIIGKSSDEIINSVVFKCNENKNIQAAFFKNKVNLVLSDGRKISLPQTISASGARYANMDESFVFWNKGDTAFVNEKDINTYKECLIDQNNSGSNLPLVEEKEISNEILKDGKYCFYRNQIATKIEPYKVEEKIILNIKGFSVVGTKKGTQSGPDMTNGFWGDLNGAKNGNDLELIYSYTVEGSNGRELEIYTIKDGNLNQLRWPLLEQKNILTPNKIGEPKIKTYIKEDCKLDSSDPVFCTADAKQCPDGSFVGRTGPKCEFICP